MSPWYTAIAPDAPPRLASDLAGLGDGDYDGHVGIVRIGAWPDQHEEQFVWSEADSMWIGSREYVVLSALDAWAMDWARQPLSSLRDKWVRPNGGVSWQVMGQRGYIDADVTLPQSDIHAKIPLAGSGAGRSWPGVGSFLLRDVLINYTSITLDGQDITFHGCTNDSSANGITMPGNHAPVIPYATEAAGDQGGWGTSYVQLDRVGDLWAAGFRLEERLDGFFNGGTDLKSVQFAPWYLNSDLDEDLGAAANFPGVFKTADSVPGLLGPGVTITGPAYDMAGFTQPGSHIPYEERGFERRTTPWTAWSAGILTKRFLTPLLYAKHAADAIASGETYSLNLMLRWTGTP